MTEHKNIYAALCAAQAEFGKVQKGSTNPAFKSRYADLADVAGVVIPTLSAHGVAVFHYIISEGDVTAMRTEFVHAASESRIACDVPLIVNKNDMQGFKSATTYAKRIGLESLSGVAPEEDDGNAAAKAPPRQQAPVGLPPEAIQAATSSLFNAASLDALKAIFLGLPTSVRSVQAVIDAKDARKAELETAPPVNADLGGDSIPY
jgi:hypothetical protein